MVSKIIKGFIRKLKQCFFHKNGLYSKHDSYESLMVPDSEFIVYLKNFNNETRNIPQTKMLLTSPAVYPKVFHIFKNYIDATDVRIDVVEKHLKFLYKADITTKLRQCIICEWIFLLNKQDTPSSFAVKQHIVEYSIFGRGERYR